MVMFASAMLCAASILIGVNITNNVFAAIVISFGIGASSMQLPCVFTLCNQWFLQKRCLQLRGFKWHGRWFWCIITCINWFYSECYS